MTGAQRAMLTMAAKFSGNMEIGELVMECSSAYDSSLAWRIADRTAGAVLRRGWLVFEGDIVTITPEGAAALKAKAGQL